MIQPLISEIKPFGNSVKNQTKKEKRISPIKIIRFTVPHNKRINIAEIPLLPNPNRAKNKTLLCYKGIFFILRLCPVSDKHRINGKNYLIHSSAHILWDTIALRSKNTARPTNTKTFGIIEIDQEIIPSCLIDLIFFHELREMYYIQGFKFPSHPHEKAVKDEKEYVKRFFSSEEKKAYRQVLEARRIYKKFLKSPEEVLKSECPLIKIERC